MDKDYMDGKTGSAPAVIDLAVLGGDLTNFALELEDTTSTLLTYDVVDLGVPLQREFLNAIRQEGIILYEEV